MACRSPQTEGTELSQCYLFWWKYLCKWLVGPHNCRLQPQSHHHATYPSGSTCKSGLSGQLAFPLHTLQSLTTDTHPNHLLIPHHLPHLPPKKKMSKIVCFHLDHEFLCFAEKGLLLLLLLLLLVPPLLYLNLSFKELVTVILFFYL